MNTKTKETAMTQLLNQLREERNKLPLPIEWDRCYQAVEMMIESTYISIEKQQIKQAVYDAMGTNFDPNMGRAELYYNEHYGK